MGSWRAIAAPIIAEVIASLGKDVDVAYVKKAISASYPFGERKYWPYKVWLSEVRRQLKRRPGVSSIDPRQGSLW